MPDRAGLPARLLGEARRGVLLAVFLLLLPGPSPASGSARQGPDRVVTIKVFVDEELMMDGTDDADRGRVWRSGTEIVAKLNGSTERFNASAVKEILFKGYGGNDHFNNRVPIYCRAYGDGGNDKLYGSAGTDELYGGSGYDRLYGSGGTDELHGDRPEDLPHRYQACPRDPRVRRLP